MSDSGEMNVEPGYAEYPLPTHIQGSTLSRKGKSVLCAMHSLHMSDDMLFKSIAHGICIQQLLAGYVNLVLVNTGF
jgi:hypothetical protein